MQRNLDATGGMVLAERAMILLAPALGRDAAGRLIAAAVTAAARGERRFGPALAAMPEVAAVLGSEALASLDAPGTYSAPPTRSGGGCSATKEADLHASAHVRTLPSFFRVSGRDDRPALILSHSLGQDHGLWDPQIEALSTHFRVVRYDIRGHGASGVVAGDYQIEALGHDALALADGLASRASRSVASRSAA